MYIHMIPSSSLGHPTQIHEFLKYLNFLVKTRVSISCSEMQQLLYVLPRGGEGSDCRPGSCQDVAPVPGPSQASPLASGGQLTHDAPLHLISCSPAWCCFLRWSQGAIYRSCNIEPTPETYMFLLTNVTPMDLINKNIFLKNTHQLFCRLKLVQGDEVTGLRFPNIPTAHDSECPALSCLSPIRLQRPCLLKIQRS